MMRRDRSIAIVLAVFAMLMTVAVLRERRDTSGDKPTPAVAKVELAPRPIETRSASATPATAVNERSTASPKPNIAPPPPADTDDQQDPQQPSEQYLHSRGNDGQHSE
jgi:hypothetical protein